MSVRDSVRHVQGSAAGQEPVRGDSRAVSGRGPGPSWTEGCSGISPGPGAYKCRGAAPYSTLIVVSLVQREGLSSPTGPVPL